MAENGHIFSIWEMSQKRQIHSEIRSVRLILEINTSEIILLIEK